MEPDQVSDSGRRAIDAGMHPRAWALRVQLAGLFRVNALLGWEDSINTHATVRLPGPHPRFLISRH